MVDHEMPQSPEVPMGLPSALKTVRHFQHALFLRGFFLWY